MMARVSREMADAPAVAVGLDMPLLRPLAPAVAAALAEQERARLRRMSTQALEDERAYLRREYQEVAALAAVTSGVTAPDDWLGHIVATGQAIKEELERRRHLERRAPGPSSLVDFAHELKQRLPLHEYVVALGYGPDMRRLGRAYRACCPLHAEKTGSFYVWEEQTPHYFCFGCGQRGDVFDLLQQLRVAHSWAEAVEEVRRYLGVPRPASRSRADALTEALSCA